MAEAQVRSWWQTFAGVLTGIAALITAAAGLIVALKQTGLIGAQPAASEIANRPDDTARPTHTANSASAKSTRRSQAAPTQQRVESAPLAPARKPYALTLPAQREYVLGVGLVKARYILLSGSVIPQTTESDVLAMEVRILAEGEYPAAFSSDQFSVTIGDKPIQPRTWFTDRVPSGESRERDIRFSIAHGSTRATLRIRVFPDHTAEIPLNMQAPTATE